MTELGRSWQDDPARIGSFIPVTNGKATFAPDVALQNSGTFTANGTSAVTVVAPGIDANSMVLFGLKTVGGTVGAIPAVKTITPGTGFTVAATASDTSVYNWAIIKKP